MVHVNQPSRQAFDPSRLQAAARLEAVRRTGLRRAGTSPALDRLARLAGAALGARLSAVSVVDRSNLYIKGAWRAGGTLPTVDALPAMETVCARVVAAGEPLRVDDVSRDRDLVENTLATRYAVHAYLGVPIMTPEGHAIGTFCVSDEQPRRWSADELETLRDFAATAFTEIEMASRPRPPQPLPGTTGEQHFRSLVEHVSDIVTILEGDGEIRFVTPSVKRALGFDPEELVGRDVFALVHPRDVPRMIHELGEGILSPGVPRAVEIRMRHRDGGWRSYEAFGSSLLHVPEVQGVVITCRDVTERRRLEEERRRLEEELHQAHKIEAVGQLTGGIAHDFGNLLTLIRGYSRMLLRTLPETHPARVDAEGIDRAARRGTALTKQLLAFSRKQRIRPRLLDPAEVLGEMEPLLDRLLGDRVRVKSRFDAVGTVRADRSQLEQVILNLAINARDAMPHGGTLEVKLCRANGAAEAVAPGEYAMLLVRDTGEGMSERTLARIFKPFFTTKPEGKGTGMGLATVHSIVEQSGGHIRVESREGVGTTFRVFFPLASGRGDA